MRGRLSWEALHGVAACPSMLGCGLKRPSTVAQLTWQITGDRSGTAGRRQMVACMSPVPRLAASRRTKIASFFNEQKCCGGSLEGVL